MKLLKHSTFEGEELYVVQGLSGVYVVKKVGEEYTCTCPSYTYRKTCKHIEFVKGGCHDDS